MCKLAFDNVNENNSLISMLNELEKVEKLLAKYKRKKEILDESIIKAVGHDHNGQKSYEFLDKKVTIKTTFNYRIDKDVYEDIKNEVPGDWVRVENKYTPIKKVLEGVELYGSSDDKLLMSEFITKTEAKPSVKVLPLV